jgi:hypothetical protein
MRTISLARRFSHPSNATEKVMNNISKALVLAVTALTLTAASASAAVVCNAEGDCWRVRGAPRYEPSLRLRIFPDSWRWREGEHYRWRDPGHGHGYWRGGSWIEIR